MISGTQVSLREQARNVLLCDNAEKKAEYALDVFTHYQKGKQNNKLKKNNNNNTFVKHIMTCHMILQNC